MAAGMWLILTVWKDKLKVLRDLHRVGILFGSGVLTEKLIHLIKTTFEKNILVGSSSAERAMLYLLAGMTGLRRKELLNIRWAGINLSAESAFVRVPAKPAKNSKEAEQHVPPATVAILQALKAQARPNDGDRVLFCPASASTSTRRSFCNRI